MFPVTYTYASVLCQLECACLHQTVNMVVVLISFNENTYPKGRALVQMYRVVPQTKRGNMFQNRNNEELCDNLFLYVQRKYQLITYIIICSCPLCHSINSFI